MPVVRRLCKRYIVVTAGKRQIAGIDKCFELRCVGITPVKISLWALPRQIAGYLNAVCQLVKRKACKIRVVVEY